MNTFTELGLDGSILRALAEERHVTPTPIQAKAIPFVMAGRDLVGIAQTGTGKTAAFALPILHRLAATRRAPVQRTCRVLVLSPTRELSNQTLDRFNAYGRHLGLRTAVVIGGVPIGKQIRAVTHGVDVLIATPGRLLDLIEQRALRLDSVEVLVLDEVDQMLDLGFIPAIRSIVAKVPKTRQNLFFSATMPPDIAMLAAQFLTNPAQVAVSPVAKTVDKVSQQVMFVETAAKSAALARLLKDPAVERALVFTRTKHGADKVVKNLAYSEIAAAAIHGNKSQPQRERTMAAFRAGKVRVLIATDIAARGIDVENISHVVNFDLPNVPESYVHRIGRTARAGAGGIAISIVDREDRQHLRTIEKLIRQSIPVLGTPVLEAAPASAAEGERRPQQRTERPASGERSQWTPTNPSGERRQGQRTGQRTERPEGGDRPHRTFAQQVGERAEPSREDRAARRRRRPDYPGHAALGGELEARPVGDQRRAEKRRDGAPKRQGQANGAAENRGPSPAFKGRPFRSKKRRERTPAPAAARLAP